MTHLAPSVIVRIEYSGMRFENTVVDTPGAALDKLAEMYDKHGIDPAPADQLRGRVRLTRAPVNAFIVTQQ